MKTGMSTAATLTSRKSRKKMVVRNCCWLRRISFSRRSALIEIVLAGSCDCHDFWKSSKFIVVSFQQGGELFADTIEFHAHIGFGDAQHLAHLAIAQTIQMHEREGSIEFRQLPDGGE